MREGGYTAFDRETYKSGEDDLFTKVHIMEEQIGMCDAEAHDEVAMSVDLESLQRLAT